MKRSREAETRRRQPGNFAYRYRRFYASLVARAKWNLRFSGKIAAVHALAGHTQALSAGHCDAKKINAGSGVFP